MTSLEKEVAKTDTTIQGEQEGLPLLPTTKPKESSTTVIVATIFFCLYNIGFLILPLYNKLLYDGFGSHNGFHFPISCTWIQTTFTAIVLAIIHSAIHIYKKYIKHDDSSTWFFKDFGTKMWELSFVSMSFVTMIVLTNIGLKDAQNYLLSFYRIG